jgi:hypothetical protein
MQPINLVHTGYPSNGGTAVVIPATGKQIHILQAKAQNKSGGAIDVGILKRFASTDWVFNSIVVANTPDATDNSAAIRAGTSTALFTTTTNDGYMVQSSQKFNMIGFTIETSEAGSPVYTYQYYNGSAFTTLTTIAVPATYVTTGLATAIVLFQAPVDWAVGSTAAVGGDLTKYSILVKASTAPSTAPKATNLWLGQFLDFQYQLANNTAFSCTFDTFAPLKLQGNESIQPYFGGTANAANCFSVSYTVNN